MHNRRTSLRGSLEINYQNKNFRVIDPINEMDDYCIDNKRLESNLKYRQVLDTTQIHVLDDIDEDENDFGRSYSYHKNLGRK